MKGLLEDSLDNNAHFLRVSPDLAQVIRAYHKEFSLTANYPKGHGELFRQWIIKNYPLEFLLHAERATGSRQDLICMSADAIYMHRPLNVEFLDERLRVKGNENILQKNLFIILDSLEMIAVSRMFSILNVSIIIPIRWLAGKTHTLAHRKWGARSMGRVCDILHNACITLLDDIKLFHDESYMMHLFDEIADELPEFKEYLKYQFQDKKTEFIKTSNTKSVPYKMLLNELFHPKDQDNKDSTSTLEEVAKIAIEAMKKELEDPNKATYKYLSISGSAFSYDHCSEEEKEAMLGKMATNDLAESSFAGVTAQVEYYGRIGMHSAAATSDMARNKFMDRPLTKKDMEKNERALLHGLPEELKVTLAIMSMEDAPATRQSNNKALETQREMKEEKERLAKIKANEKATDEFIENLIYHSMYDSDACWKTVGEVTPGLRKLKWKKDKLQALKDNIQIRYRGFRWNEWKTQWSHASVNKTVPELEKRLKDLMKEEKLRKRPIPSKPKVPVPERASMPVLGTATTQMGELDKKAAAKKEEFERNARKEWKDGDFEGLKSVYHYRQDRTAPKVDESLIGTRIEYLCGFEDDDGNSVGNRWCAGVVNRISDDENPWVRKGKTRACYKAGEAAEIYWDEIPEAKMKACLSIEPLDPKKWNKDCEEAWRKDLGDYNYGL